MASKPLMFGPVPKTTKTTMTTTQTTQTTIRMRTTTMTKTVRATSVLARGTIFGALFSALAWATPGLASQTEVFSVEGADLFGGDLDGASIGGDFRVRSGPEQKAILAEVPGAVLSI